MTDSVDLKMLCNEIMDMIKLGFTLDSGLLHFLSSTFSVTTREALEDMKNPGREDDLNLFLELVVSPDLIMMEKLEHLISDKVFSSEDEHELSNTVYKNVARIPVYFPDEPFPISFAVTHETIQLYIKKLRITYTIPGSLLDDMKQWLTEKWKIKTCVQLRQTACPMNKRNESFLSLFFRESSSFGLKYPEHLNLALLIMVCSGEEEDLKEALILRLRSFQKTLEQIRASEGMMKKNTMETLMLQGFRIPPSSPDIIEDNMIMLRRILSSLYGWLDMGDNRVSEIDLGCHESNDSMENVIRLLS
ncbi:MAG: hypothetical protein WC799_01570 [Desulfobacteraceae bacterium]|jgi:hypothetical protein